MYYTKKQYPINYIVLPFHNYNSVMLLFCFHLTRAGASVTIGTAVTLWLYIRTGSQPTPSHHPLYSMDITPQTMYLYCRCKSVRTTVTKLVCFSNFRLTSRQKQRYREEDEGKKLMPT